MIEGVDVIEKNVSCDYAVTGKAFCEEMNKQFPGYNTTMYRYLKNSELIDQIYGNKITIAVFFEKNTVFRVR